MDSGLGATSKTRAGSFIAQPSGFRAFVPAALPPNPPVALDDRLLGLLSSADLALGRLDGIVRVVPDPELFVAMYVRREAVLSSQIEGTLSTLEDLLEVELEPERAGRLGDVGEIVNYVRAMNHGLERLQALPLSLRLIREIHGELLRDGRGTHAAGRVPHRRRTGSGRQARRSATRDLRAAARRPRCTRRSTTSSDSCTRDGRPAAARRRRACARAVRDDPSVPGRQRPGRAAADHVPARPPRAYCASRCST